MQNKFELRRKKLLERQYMLEEEIYQGACINLDPNSNIHTLRRMRQELLLPRLINVVCGGAFEVRAVLEFKADFQSSEDKQISQKKQEISNEHWGARPSYRKFLYDYILIVILLFFALLVLIVIVASMLVTDATNLVLGVAILIVLASLCLYPGVTLINSWNAELEEKLPKAVTWRNEKVKTWRQIVPDEWLEWMSILNSWLGDEFAFSIEHFKYNDGRILILVLHGSEKQFEDSGRDVYYIGIDKIVSEDLESHSEVASVEAK